MNVTIDFQIRDDSTKETYSFLKEGEFSLVDVRTSVNKFLNSLKDTTEVIVPQEPLKVPSNIVNVPTEKIVLTSSIKLAAEKSQEVIPEVIPKVVPKTSPRNTPKGSGERAKILEKASKDRAHIAILHAEGKTILEMTKIVGLSWPSVYHHLKTLNVDPNAAAVVKSNKKSSEVAREKRIEKLTDDVASMGAGHVADKIMAKHGVERTPLPWEDLNFRTAVRRGIDAGETSTNSNFSVVKTLQGNYHHAPSGFIKTNETRLAICIKRGGTWYYRHADGGNESKITPFMRGAISNK